MTNARHDDSLLMDLDLLRNIENERIAEARQAEIDARNAREQEALEQQRRAEAEEASRQAAAAKRLHDLETARLRAEAETQRLAIEARARLEDKRLAIELARVEAEAAQARMALRPKRRWFPALAAAVCIALGAWFYTSNQAQERRHQDLMAELAQVEAKAGELERRAAEMPDVEPVDYGDVDWQPVDSGEPDGEPVAEPADTEPERPRPPRRDPRPEPEPEPDDGRIDLPLDCMTTPMGCME